MKTITLLLALFTFSFCASQEQDLPNDLTAISQADAPPFATYYSNAYWPDYPPLPLERMGLSRRPLLFANLRNELHLGRRPRKSSRQNADGILRPSTHPRRWRSRWS